jgi:type I restriction enzyme S subunit
VIVAETPKIRFKGFVDAWEQRKLSELSDTFEYGLNAAAKEFDGENKYIRITDIDDASHEFNGDDVTSPDTDLANAENYKLADGDILFARTGASVGKTYIYKKSDGVVYYAGFLIRARIKKEYNPEFVFQNTLTADYEKYIAVTSQRSGQPGVNAQEYSEYKIMIPGKAEQDKVSAYLGSLDQIITLHQHKCDETKELKRYMLQKMFPRNGKKNPEIRFAGFTDDWEQRKLGEITELKSASRVHREEWTTEGVPFYRSSDVMAAINGTENDKAFISQKLYQKLSSVSGRLEAGDILVTGGGSVGNPYIVPDNAPLYTKDADLLWIKNQGRFNPYFVYEFFLSPSFRSYLGSISHVGTIAHYTITQLSETPISLPSVEEQDKLGKYFQRIDHLITLHQRKCDELKEVKKFMLQNMFPQKG